MSSSLRVLILFPAAVAFGWQPPPGDLREAARLDAQGKCLEAERIYRRALGAGAPSPALLNNAGNHYLACGDRLKATEYFGVLVKRLPAHPNANLQLARLAGGDKNRALPYLRALAAQTDPGILAEIGAMYAQLGEYALAQQAFQPVAAARPGDFQAQWNLGRAAARAGDLARAKDALSAALRLKADDPEVLFAAGAAHAAAGEFPRAVFLLARAQSRAPGRPDIALALARASSDAGFYGDSALAYDRYLALKPDDAGARRDRAFAAANTASGRDEGTKALAVYVERNPNDPLGHLKLAQLIWKSDAGGSLGHLADAVRLDGKLAPAHVARAWLLHRMGRDAEALPHLERALALHPRDIRALDQYGLVLSALERMPDAEKALRKAAALAPADWEVRLHLGRTLMELGREAEAKQWLDEYQKLRPTRQRDPRREAGMIDLATLPAAEAQAKEMERISSLARARPDDPSLLLAAAIAQALSGRLAEAESQLIQIQERWPEWNRPYLAHAVLLTERNRPLEAAQKHRIAVALGADPERDACKTLRDWSSPACLEGVK